MPSTWTDDVALRNQNLEAASPRNGRESRTSSIVRTIGNRAKMRNCEETALTPVHHGPALGE